MDRRHSHNKRHNDRDLNRLWYLSPGMPVNTRYPKSSSGTASLKRERLIMLGSQQTRTIFLRPQYHLLGHLLPPHPTLPHSTHTHSSNYTVLISTFDINNQIKQLRIGKVKWQHDLTPCPVLRNVQTSLSCVTKRADIAVLCDDTCRHRCPNSHLSHRTHRPQPVRRPI